MANLQAVNGGPGGGGGPAHHHRPGDRDVPPQPPPKVPGPSHSARRAAVEAAKEQATAVTAHPQVWQPWQRTITEAEARLKREIAGALREVEQGLAAASAVLDSAQAEAEQAAGRLQDAATAAWQSYTRLAEHTRNRILGPAEAAYEAAVDAASARYADVLAEAGKDYQAAITAADSARTMAAAVSGGQLLQ